MESDDDKDDINSISPRISNNTRSRTSNKRRRPEPDTGNDENADSAPETPAAKQPRRGLYGRVSGVVGRVVGMLTPGKKLLAGIDRDDDSPVSSINDANDRDVTPGGGGATAGAQNNPAQDGEEWSPEHDQDRWQPTAVAGKAKERSSSSGGGGSGGRAAPAAAGEDTRESGRPEDGGGFTPRVDLSSAGRGGFGGSPDNGLGVGELHNIAGGTNVAGFSPGVRHILRDEARLRSRPGRRSSMLVRSERQRATRMANRQARASFGDGEQRSIMGASIDQKEMNAGAVRGVDAGGLSHQNGGGRESLEEGAGAGFNLTGASTDSLGEQRKTFVFGNRPVEATTPQAPRNNSNSNRSPPPDEDGIFARSGGSRSPRRSLLQRRRDAAAAALLSGGGRGQGGAPYEETEEDEENNTAADDEGDDPFTASEGRDLVRALRFRRNLPPSAAMYLLSKMESRAVARLRMQVLREYKETMGRSWQAPGGENFGAVGEAAPVPTLHAPTAHADGSGNAASSSSQLPPIVAPIARRRAAPPGTDLVPTAPLQNSPLMLPPPPRGGEFSNNYAAAGARGALESRDGVRSRAPNDRRSSVAGGEMLAPRVTRGGDPDGLLTPAHKARATARRQSLREPRSFAHSTPGGDRVWQPATTANQGTPWAGAPRTHVRGEGSGGSPRSRVHEEPPAVGGDDMDRRTPSRYSLGALRSPAAMARRVISLLDDAASLRTPLRLSPPSATPSTVVEDVVVRPDTAYAEEGRLPTRMLSVPYPNTKADSGAGNDDRDKERKARLASPAAKLPPSRWARREIQTQTDDGLIGGRGGGGGGSGSGAASPSPRRQSRKRKTDEYVQDEEGKDASAPAREGEGGKEMEVDGGKSTAVGTQMSPAATMGKAGVVDDVESTGISPHRNKRARTNSEILLDQQLKQGGGKDADAGYASSEKRKHDARSSFDGDGKSKSSAAAAAGREGDKKSNGGDDGDLAASETPKRPDSSIADGADREGGAHGTDRHLGGKSPYVRGDGGMKPPAERLTTKPRPYRSAAASGVRFTDSETQQEKKEPEYWICRGCYVRQYIMDATECDLCHRSRKFGTPYYRQPKAVLANGRTLHNVRINLEAAKMSTPARSTPATSSAAPTAGSGPAPGSETASAVATGVGSTPKSTSVRFSSDTKGASPTPTPPPASTPAATATATAAPSVTPTPAPAPAPATPGPGFTFAGSGGTSLSTPAPAPAAPSTPAFSFGGTTASASASTAAAAAAAPAPAVSDTAAATAARPAKRTAFQFSAPASTAADATAPTGTTFGTTTEKTGSIAVAPAPADKATPVAPAPAAPAPAPAFAGFTFGSAASKTPAATDTSATAAAPPAATTAAPEASTVATFKFGGTSSATLTAAKSSPAESGTGVTAAPTASFTFKSGTDATPKSPPKSKGGTAFSSFAAPAQAPVAAATSTAGFTFGAAAATASSGAAPAPVPAANPAPAPAASPFLFGGAAPAPAPVAGATAAAAAPAAGATGASTGLAMPAPTTFPAFGTAAFGSTVGGVRAPSPAGSIGGFAVSGQGAPKRGASPAGGAGGFGPSGQGAPKRGASLASPAFGGGAAGAFGTQPGATGLFGAAGADSTAAPPASTGGFSFGAAAAPAATGFGVQPPSTQFGATAPAAGTAAGGFGMGAAGGFASVGGAAPVVRPPANPGGAFSLGAQQTQQNTNKAGRRMVKGRRPKKR